MGQGRSRARPRRGHRLTIEESRPGGPRRIVLGVVPVIGARVLVPTRKLQTLLVLPRWIAHSRRTARSSFGTRSSTESAAGLSCGSHASAACTGSARGRRGGCRAGRAASPRRSTWSPVRGNVTGNAQVSTLLGIFPVEPRNRPPAWLGGGRLGADSGALLAEVARSGQEHGAATNRSWPLCIVWNWGWGSPARARAGTSGNSTLAQPRLAWADAVRRPHGSGGS